MIVSALLTAVGINLGLCVFFFALYSVLRKQPGNAKVYASRLVAEGKSDAGEGFNLERFLPTTGWVRRAWQPTEDDLLATLGLDAVVFMRIFVLSLRIFCVAGIIGIFVILPVNYEGGQLQTFDFFNVTHESVDKFSISNVKDGSKWLWIHFSAAYIMTGVVCYLLYLEYKHITSRRIEYFYSSKAEPQQFTILVRGIPTSPGSHVSDKVDNFFKEHHPSTYFSHVVVQRTSKLRCLIKDAERLYKRLTHLKSKHEVPERSGNGGFLGFFRKNADSVRHYGKKLEDLEENVRLEQSATSFSREEIPAAFVCFKTRYGAAAAIHIPQSNNPINWVTEQAPEPHDVFWPFFSTSFMRRWISKLVVFVASIVLTIVFLIPVLFVQGLTNLDQLKTLLPFLKNVLNIAFVSQVITGYLPSLILYMFLCTVPPIMNLFSTMQGYISYSEIERSSCRKMLWFTIWNIFFANVLSGSIASQFEVIFDPRHIPVRLAVVVPAQASFFIAYVVTSGWTSLSSELTRTMSLLCDFIRRHCCKNTEENFHAPPVPYESEIPHILFFGLLGITYFILAPLILPFILVYFCLGYVIYRNQLLNVYLPKYETGGKYWPSVHNTMIFSLILMQAIAVGIFVLKKLPLASSLTIPLPFMTLLFNDYCRKRFLPVFDAYSAESLLKKDREDQSDAAMGDFFNKLATAYRDPALMPIRFSGSPDSRTSPFLSPA